MQCGADSLTGDRLGCFNLSLHGHASCIEFVKNFCLPVLFLGGGGYTIRNVARCWTYETSIILDCELPNELPMNEYFEYYGPDFTLQLTPSNMENQNSNEYLEKIRNNIFENLRYLESPNVGLMDHVPDFFDNESSDDEEYEDPDKRFPTHLRNKNIQPDEEFSDSEDIGNEFPKNLNFGKRSRCQQSDFVCPYSFSSHMENRFSSNDIASSLNTGSSFPRHGTSLWTIPLSSSIPGHSVSQTISKQADIMKNENHSNLSITKIEKQPSSIDSGDNPDNIPTSMMPMIDEAVVRENSYPRKELNLIESPMIHQPISHPTSLLPSLDSVGPINPQANKNNSNFNTSPVDHVGSVNAQKFSSFQETPPEIVVKNLPTWSSSPSISNAIYSLINPSSTEWPQKRVHTLHSDPPFSSPNLFNMETAPPSFQSEYSCSGSGRDPPSNISSSFSHLQNPTTCTLFDFPRLASPSNTYSVATSVTCSDHSSISSSKSSNSSLFSTPLEFQSIQTSPFTSHNASSTQNKLSFPSIYNTTTIPISSDASVTSTESSQQQSPIAFQRSFDSTLNFLTPDESVRPIHDSSFYSAPVTKFPFGFPKSQHRVDQNE